MNAGFSNLAWLKAQLLPASNGADTRFDKLITALGLGMAKMFSNHCNRPFERMVDAQQVFSADRCEFTLSRRPVEVVTLSEVKIKEADGWVAQDATFIRALDQNNGIINTGDSDIGPYYGQVRFTFTGGFWWEMLDEKDAGYPSAFPAGATALPDDLRQAWILQCRHIWSKLDKLGVDLLRDGSEQSLRFPNEFAPTVELTLGQYRNFTLV